MAKASQYLLGDAPRSTGIADFRICICFYIFICLIVPLPWMHFKDDLLTHQHFVCALILNIATGETSPVITPFHLYGYSNFSNFYQLITVEHMQTGVTMQLVFPRL